MFLPLLHIFRLIPSIHHQVTQETKFLPPKISHTLRLEWTIINLSNPCQNAQKRIKNRNIKHIIIHSTTAKQTLNTQRHCHNGKKSYFSLPLLQLEREMEDYCKKRCSNFCLVPCFLLFCISLSCFRVNDPRCLCWCMVAIVVVVLYHPSIHRDGKTTSTGSRVLWSGYHPSTSVPLVVVQARRKGWRGKGVINPWMYSIANIIVAIIIFNSLAIALVGVWPLFRPCNFFGIPSFLDSPGGKLKKTSWIGLVLYSYRVS